MSEQLKEWALKEVREVKRAPAAIMVLLVAGAIGGWTGARMFYAERMEVLELLRTAQGLVLAPKPEPASISVLPYGRRVDIAVATVLMVTFGGFWLNLRRARRLRREGVVSRELLDVAARENAGLRKERDENVVALKNKKHEYAMEILGRYSRFRFRDDVTPRVTVRYCHYTGDDEVAQQIKHLFTQYVKWEVTLDGSNNPALPRAGRFKVVFDVGMTVVTYGELVHAFSEGNLLGATVGVQQFTEREDTSHLIVLVLPSADIGPPNS